MKEERVDRCICKYRGEAARSKRGVEAGITVRLPSSNRCPALDHRVEHEGRLGVPFHSANFVASPHLPLSLFLSLSFSFFFLLFAHRNKNFDSPLWLATHRTEEHNCRRKSAREPDNGPPTTPDAINVSMDTVSSIALYRYPN